MFNLNLQEVVVGSNLSALLYAYCNDVPFVAIRQLIPHTYDFFNEEIDLSRFFLTSQKNKFLTLHGEKYFGLSKALLWHNLNYILSLSSRNVVPFNIMSIKIEDSTLKIITKNASLIRINFEKLTVFDSFKIEGLPKDAIRLFPLKFKVYDWINVHSGNAHKLDLIENDDNLARQIFFYNSTRGWWYPEREGELNSKMCKDIVAVSEIDAKDLHSFEYSDTGVMFLVKNIMKEAGIKGTSNGHYPNNPNKKTFLSIRLSLLKRELIEIISNKKNLLYKNLNFLYNEPEEFIQIKIKNSYMRNLHNNLNNLKLKREKRN